MRYSKTRSLSSAWLLAYAALSVNHLLLARKQACSPLIFSFRLIVTHNGHDGLLTKTHSLCSFTKKRSLCSLQKRQCCLIINSQSSAININKIIYQVVSIEYLVVSFSLFLYYLRTRASQPMFSVGVFLIHAMPAAPLMNRKKQKSTMENILLSAMNKPMPAMLYSTQYIHASFLR